VFQWILSKVCAGRIRVALRRHVDLPFETKTAARLQRNIEFRTRRRKVNASFRKKLDVHRKILQ
jgi:hypothetical protein